MISRKKRLPNLKPLVFALAISGYGLSALAATSQSTEIDSQQAWDSLVAAGSDLSNYSVVIDAGSNEQPLVVDDDFSLRHTSDLQDTGSGGPFVIQGGSVVNFSGSTMSVQSSGSASSTSSGAFAVKGSSTVNVGSADNHYDSIHLATEGAASALYVDASAVDVYVDTLTLDVHTSDASGIWIKSGSDLGIFTSSPVEINFNESATGGNYGIRHDGGDLTLNGDLNIHFAGESGTDSYGIRTQAGTLSLGNVSITAEGSIKSAVTNEKAGILGTGGTIEILGNLSINLGAGTALSNTGSKSETTVHGDTYINVIGSGNGIYVSAGSVTLDGNSVDVSTQSAYALYAASSGTVTVDTGSVNIQSDEAYAVYSSSTVEIAGSGSVTLRSNADAAVATSNKGEVTVKGSVIDIAGVTGIYAGTLPNPQSSSVTLTGSEVTVTGIGTQAEAGKSLETGLAGTISINAAKTTLNGDIVLNGTSKFAASGQDSEPATLTINGDVSADEGTEVALTNQRVELMGNFSVDALTGSNTELLVHDFDNSISISKNSIETLGLVVSGDLNDQYANGSDAMKALQSSAVITSEDGGSVTYSGEAGTVSGGWTYDPQTGSVKESANASLVAMGDFNAMTLALWRNQANHLFERLGSIRDDRGEMGVWARVYGNDGSVDHDVSIDLKSTSIQVGADVGVGANWIIGGAFSYTDATADFSNGDGKTDIYSLAAYATGMFDCGGYIDIVGRIGRLSSDVRASTMSAAGGILKGSYDNTAFSLSAEVGYRWELTETFYIEPQAELAYGFVSGDDFRSSNGVKYEQDDFQSLVGRIGSRFGAKLPQEAGTIFMHASVLHDFLGEADGTASPRQGLARDVNVDIGGTWFAYGIGAQFDMRKNLSFYGVLERSTGSDYQDDYRYSVALSYRF